MLRTVVVRSNLIKGNVRKVLRNNVTRVVTTECAKRKYNTKPCIVKPVYHPQWPEKLVRHYSSLPPHTKVTLPALSPTMETGDIISWEKKEGDKLKEGDLLAEIETDKASMGFETPEEGFLAKIIIPAGSKKVPVGKLVCIIVENEADIAAFKNYTDDGSAAAPAAAAPPPAPSAPAPAAPPPPAAAAAAPPSNLPAHTPVTLPALSPTMEAGKIVKWEKKEGDKLNEGDLLAEIETDKATMGFETPEEGYLAKILIPDGTKDVPVGKLVCVIVENQADIAAFKNFTGDGAAAAAPAAAPAKAPSPGPSAPGPAPAPSAPAAGSSHRVFASPMAKRLAEQRQIRLQGKGTGLFGSITSSDLAKMPAGAPAAAAAPRAGSPPPAGKPAAAPGQAYIDIPISNIREVIAKRLTQSKQLLPHYYVFMDVTVDKIMALRQMVNKKLEKQKVRLSVNDFVIKAAALACLKVPETNSAWMDTKIRQYSHVDISVAVSSDKGLITPIIFGADSKGVIDISKDMKVLAAKAREGKLKPQEYQGGTFCVSNMGMFGVTAFTSIINLPQACILSVGGAKKQLVLDPSSPKGFKEISYMTVTLSSDHRIVDGALAAQWLSAFRDYFEYPETMIL